MFLLCNVKGKERETTINQAIDQSLYVDFGSGMSVCPTKNQSSSMRPFMDIVESFLLKLATSARHAVIGANAGSSAEITLVGNRRRSIT